MYLKYQQELDLIKFKEDRNKEIQDIVYTLVENTVSVRNIKAKRSLLLKLDEINSNETHDKIHRTSEDIFNFILSDFAPNANGDTYRRNYIESKDEIILYMDLSEEIKDERTKFRNNQKIELKRLSDAAMDEGIPMSVLNYMYKRIKSDICISKTECSVSAIYVMENVYNELRIQFFKKFDIRSENDKTRGYEIV